VYRSFWHRKKKKKRTGDKTRGRKGQEKHQHERLSSGPPLEVEKEMTSPFHPSHPGKEELKKGDDDIRKKKKTNKGAVRAFHMPKGQGSV